MTHVRGIWPQRWDTEGALPVLTVNTDWSWHRWNHLYGTFTYNGVPVFGLASTSLHGLVTVPRCPRPVSVNVICFGGGRPECRWSWPRAEGGRPA